MVITAYADARFNGTWIYVETGEKWVMKNGDFEATLGKNITRGTFTVNNGLLTSTVTHFLFDNEMASEFGIEPNKWLTANEFIVAFNNFAQRQRIPDVLINKILDLLINFPPFSYSIDVNTMVLTQNVGGTRIVRIFNRH